MADDAAFLRRGPSTTKRYGANASTKRDRRLSAISSGHGHVQQDDQETDAASAAHTYTASRRKATETGSKTAKSSFRWSDSSEDDCDNDNPANVGRLAKGTQQSDAATSIEQKADSQHNQEKQRKAETERDQQRAIDNLRTQRPAAVAKDDGAEKLTRRQTSKGHLDDDIPPPTPSKRKRHAEKRTEQAVGSRHSSPSKQSVTSRSGELSTPKTRLASALEDGNSVQQSANSQSPTKRKRELSQTSPSRKGNATSSSVGDEQEKIGLQSTQPDVSVDALKSPARDLSRVFENFAVNAKVASKSKGKSAATSLAARLKGKTKTFIQESDDTTEDNQSNMGDSRSDVLPRERTPTAALSPSRTPTHSPRPNSPLPTVLAPGHAVSPLKINSRPVHRMASLNAEAVQIGPRGNVGSRKTYGGSRSFKPDVEEEEMLLGKNSQPEIRNSPLASATPASNGIISRMLPQIPRKPTERRSYSAMREMLGIDQDEEDEQSLKASQLRSVSQLRAKGESSRFVDELNYLMEGLQADDSLPGRRSAALEILRRMQDRDFFKKLKSSGFDERVYMQFRRAGAGDGDQILDSALAFLVVVLVRDQRIAEALCRISDSAFRPSSSPADAYETETSDLLSFFGAALERDWSRDEIGGGFAKGKSLSKSDARYLASLRKTIDEFNLLEPGTLAISVRSLALLGISIVSSYAPRSIFQPQQMLCISGTFQTVVFSFVAECSGLQARFAKYERGLELLPSDDSINIYIIDLCLRVFETTTSATPLAVALLNSQRAALSLALVNLVLACHILVVRQYEGVDSDKLTSAALDNLLSALRFMIDLTTNDSDWSTALAEVPGIVSVLVKLIVTARTQDKDTVRRFKSLSSSPDSKTDSAVADLSTDARKRIKEDIKFDILCLSLGVLTNLVESVEHVQNDLRTTTIDATCRMDRKCTLQCHCPNRTSALDRLSALYLDPLKDSSNELNNSFINGYAGITLGLVMLDNSQNQEIVLRGLKNDPKARSRLIKALQEFAELHMTAAESGEDDTDHYDQQTARQIQKLVERLRRG
ncbi:hypothetical protein OIV83_005580 [Microbotryomycetes sp. JL201]|nr:hypothetical protein OIV83_005580 [Microbotryomycetes sp. JL201]